MCTLASLTDLVKEVMFPGFASPPVSCVLDFPALPSAARENCLNYSSELQQAVRESLHLL